MTLPAQLKRSILFLLPLFLLVSCDKPLQCRQLGVRTNRTYSCNFIDHQLPNTLTIKFGGISDALAVNISSNAESLRFRGGSFCAQLKELFVLKLTPSPPFQQSDSLLKYFDFLYLPVSLVKVRLRHHRLRILYNTCYLRKMMNLAELDLQFNELVHFEFGCLPASIKRLDLSDNRMLNNLTIKSWVEPRYLDFKVLLYQMFKVKNIEYLDLTISRSTRQRMSCERLCNNYKHDYTPVLWYLDEWRLNECDYVLCYLCHVLRNHVYYGLENANYFWTVFKSNSCIPTSINPTVMGGWHPPIHFKFMGSALGLIESNEKLKCVKKIITASKTCNVLFLFSGVVA